MLLITESPKQKAELAYETLKSDLTSVENNDQTVENQKKNNVYASKSVKRNKKKQRALHR